MEPNKKEIQTHDRNSVRLTLGKETPTEDQQGQISCCHSDHDHQPLVDQEPPVASDEPYSWCSETVFNV